jgi:hypothetical protein
MEPQSFWVGQVVKSFQTNKTFKTHYRVYESPLMVSVVRQMNPVSIPTHFLPICFNIVLPCTLKFPKKASSFHISRPQFWMHFASLSYMYRQSHPSWFHYRNSIWWHNDVAWLWPTLPISRPCTSLTMAYGHGKVANNTVSTLRIRADVRHAWLDECALRAMWEKLKLIYDGGDSGNKKCKQGSVGAHCRVWRSLRLAGVWNLVTGSRFCVCAIGSNLVSLTVKMFSHLI